MIRTVLILLLLCTSSFGQSPKLLMDARNCKTAVGWQKPVLYGHGALQDLLLGSFPAEKTKQAALKHDGILPAIVNIEAYHMPDQRDKLLSVLNVWRTTAPGKKFGVYMMMPIRSYWAPIDRQRKPLDFVKWQADNTLMRPLADAVDCIFPSLYTFYPQDGFDRWALYAKGNVDEAKKYGKPVYPFIWPRFHGNGRKDATGKPLSDQGPIPTDQFRKQIQWCLENCDGVVVWDWIPRNPDQDPTMIATTKLMEEFK